MKRIAFFDQKPVQYYENIRIMADYGVHDQIMQVIQTIIATGNKILDYGAGAGALSQRLHDNGYKVVAVDVNQEDFKADTLFEELDINNSKERTLFINSHLEEFDLVLGAEVIEHVENPWQYCRDMRDLVKPGGYIVLTTPNIKSWYSRVRFFFTGRFHQFEDPDRSYGHINPVGDDEIRLICEQIGLVVKGIFPAGWLPRVWITSSFKRSMINMFGFISSFFMRGLWEGWGILAVVYKPEDMK